jgi:hypothetical protein
MQKHLPKRKLGQQSSNAGTPSPMEGRQAWHRCQSIEKCREGTQNASSPCWISRYMVVVVEKPCVEKLSRTPIYMLSGDNDAWGHGTEPPSFDFDPSAARADSVTLTSSAHCGLSQHPNAFRTAALKQRTQRTKIGAPAASGFGNSFARGVGHLASGLCVRTRQSMLWAHVHAQVFRVRGLRLPSRNL